MKGDWMIISKIYFDIFKILKTLEIIYLKLLKVPVLFREIHLLTEPLSAEICIFLDDILEKCESFSDERNGLKSPEGRIR